MRKRIAIVGAGAVGGHVGGHLARTGHDVTLIDPWAAHVDYMKQHGLELSGVTEEERYTVPVRALHVTEAEMLSRERPIDIAFVCMKSYDTEWATMLIRQYLAPDGFVVSLQNAINEEAIAAIVGWGKTVGCIASMIAVELYEPGHIRRNVPLGGEEHIVFRVGEPHGRITPRIEEVAEMLTAADSSKATSNLWGERWSKLVANSMRNGLYAVTGHMGGDIDVHDAARRTAARLAGEAVVVGLAHGYVLEEIYHIEPELLADVGHGKDGAFERLDEILLSRARRSNRAGTHRPSMAQDIAKGRRTEIEYLNGFVCRKGAELGLATPTNAAMVELVKRVERGELTPGMANVDKTGALS